MFLCDKCGLCCQNLNGSSLYDFLNDGSGTCINYDKETKLCRIYENRPLLCRVDECYPMFAESMSYDEYLMRNYEACAAMKLKADLKKNGRE